MDSWIKAMQLKRCFMSLKKFGDQKSNKTMRIPNEENHVKRLARN